MFEFEASTQVPRFAAVDDAGVIDALRVSAVAENAAAGRVLAWMGELYARRAPADDVDRVNWAAIALRERLPRVAAVFATGLIDYRMMAALVNRSDNVTDPVVLARLDGSLAKCAEVDADVGAEIERAYRYVGGEVRPGRGA